MPLEAVRAVLLSWNQLNNPPLAAGELEHVLKNAGRYAPDQTNQGRVDISNVYDGRRMIEAYREHIKTLKSNRFITGIHEIDKRIRGISGGEVLTIIARSGCFKTATLQNLLLNYTHNSKWAAVFFSVEMPVYSVTERYFQNIFGEPGQEVETMFSGAGETDPESFAAVCQEFEAKMRNLLVIPSRIGLSDIPSYVDLIQREKGIKVGVVGIDYLGLMDGPGRNEYEIVSELAKGTKRLSKMLNIPIILLAQTNRSGGDGRKEISLDMARASGQIEEAADIVLGLYTAPDTGKVIVGSDKQPEALICKILKSRKSERDSRFKLDMDPVTFQLGPDATIFNPKKETPTF